MSDERMTTSDQAQWTRKRDKRKALQMMAMRASAPDYDIIRFSLHGSDEDVAMDAADALGHIGPSLHAVEFVERLIQLMTDKSNPGALRDTCAYALGRIGVRTSEVVESLRLVAKESNSVGLFARESLRDMDRETFSEQFVRCPQCSRRVECWASDVDHPNTEVRAHPCGCVAILARPETKESPEDKEST